MSDQIINILAMGMSTPMTDLYLPKLLLNSKGTKLEPYGPTSFNLGRHAVMGLPMDIRLENVIVKGLSNIQIAKAAPTPQNPIPMPRVSTVNNQVTFFAVRPNTDKASDPVAAQVLNGVSEKLDIDATFIITPVGWNSLTPGTVDITVTNAEIKGVFNVLNPNNPNTVATSFTHFSINPPINKSNIHIKLEVNSMFKDIINNVLNTPKMYTQFVNQLNEQLQQPAVLKSISDVGTPALRSVLKDSPFVG